VPLVVRSWNVFHGNSLPPERRGHLEDCVRLVTGGAPDLVCLQEVPPWAFERLDEWSGMTAVGEVAAAPSVGPVPISRDSARRLTRLHAGRLRSLFSGQGNAILAARRFRVRDAAVLVLNERRFRRAQSRWLRLSRVAQLAWAAERRVVHGVRLDDGEGRTLFAANLHATHCPADERLPDAELLRAATWADALARPNEPVVLAGDFNVTAKRSWNLAELTGPEWGFAGGGPGVDHVLVRGLALAGRVQRWDDDRRRIDGRLLSDHGVVEARAEWP
jgi:endonuclease/exonuclease/phosphatase family metal-dependent hydrolase